MVEPTEPMGDRAERERRRRELQPAVDRLLARSGERAALGAFIHHMATAALHDPTAPDGDIERLERAAIWAALRPDGSLDWGELHDGAPVVTAENFHLVGAITDSFQRAAQAIRGGRP